MLGLLDMSLELLFMLPLGMAVLGSRVVAAGIAVLCAGSVAGVEPIGITEAGAVVFVPIVLGLSVISMVGAVVPLLLSTRIWSGAGVVVCA